VDTAEGPLAGPSISSAFQVVLQDIELPAGITDRVLALADALSVPMKDVLLAAHVKVLGLVAGERTVLTGYEHSGRPELPDAEAALGLFLNTVPLPVDLEETGDGLGLVQALHEAETELMPHRRVPLARLVQFMAGTRIDVHFGFLRFHELARAGIVDDDRIGTEPVMRYEPTNFALGVALIQDPGSDRVLLAVDHLRSLVPDALADAYADAFATALAGLADPVPVG
jgi:non-ribosomal peptide synthetase component F